MASKLVGRATDGLAILAVLVGAALFLAWLAPTSDPEKKSSAPAAKLFDGEFRGLSPEQIEQIMDGPGAPRSVGQ
jgi:hypothetical protein